MMEKKAGAWRFSVTAFVYCIGNAYIAAGSGGAGRDEWLCLLIGTLIGLPLVWLLARVCMRDSGMDLYSILQKRCPRALCRAFSALYALYGLALASMALSCFSRYTAALILTQTPKAVIALLFALCAFFAACRAPSSICRLSGFLMPMIAAVIAAVWALSLSSMHLSRLLPVGRSVTAAHVLPMLAFPFAEPVLFTTLAPEGGKALRYRHFFAPYLAGALVLILGCVRNTCVLGDHLAPMFAFPTAAADSVVGYESLHQRLEALTTMIPAAAGLVDCVLALRLCVRGADTLLDKPESRVRLALSALAAWGLCIFLFRTDAALRLKDRLWPYLSLSVQLSAPSLTLLFGKKEISAKGKNLIHCLKKTMK